MGQGSGNLARTAGAASLLLLLAAPAFAQNAYLGAGLGKSRADFDTLGDTIDDESENTVVKFFAGYRFFGYLALEAFFVDLRDYSATVQTGAGPLAVSAQAEGPGAALLAFVPLGGGAELFVKGGVLNWDVETVGDRVHDADPMYGIGLHFKGASPAASVRIEYERFTDVGAGLFGGSDNGIDVDLLSLGVIYNF